MRDTDVSGVTRSALLEGGGRHIIEDVPTSYLKQAFVVYVATMSIDLTDLLHGLH